MNQRKHTPKQTEADVFEQSGRRCCVCFALNNDFSIKKGQIAHLDGNPSNSKFDNLCFMCLEHHDDYDTKRSQSKGLTLTEIKRYRANLYEKVLLRKESIQYIDTFPMGADAPLLDYYEENDIIIGKTTKGVEIVEGQASLRLADKDLSGRRGIPSLILSFIFFESKSEKKARRNLRIIANMPFGITLQTEVSAGDDWNVTGFVNVLRNKEDIWVLPSFILETDKREPLQQVKDHLLIYRKANGENHLSITTYMLTRAPFRIHARFSQKVADGLADYLERYGFTAPFKQ